MSPIAAYILFMSREQERQIAVRQQPVRPAGPSVADRLRSALGGLRVGSGVASPASRSGGSAA